MSRRARSAALVLAFLAVLVPAACALPITRRADWRTLLRAQLAVLGHRNWIVVADAAYPMQQGIVTIYTGAGQREVLREVLAAIDAAPHVRAVVHLDAELDHVPERDAPGVTAYRDDLAEMLGGRTVGKTPHERIVAQLGEASGSFRVLLFKTRMTIPYTSVFLELRAGYWGDEEEKRLRETMAGGGR